MDFQADIGHCLLTLQQGGTILYPTDTVWGLGCDGTNQTAVEKLLQIKHRTALQGLIIILGNEEDIVKYSELPVNNGHLKVGSLPANKMDEGSIAHFLTTTLKPTTVIYEKGKGVAPAVLNADGSIAIRVVKDDFCQQLLYLFGKPIVSTSANIHGEPTPSFYSEISQAVKSDVDHIVQYRRDDETPRQSSALVRWLGNGQVETIRP